MAAEKLNKLNKLAGITVGETLVLSAVTLIWLLSDKGSSTNLCTNLFVFGSSLLILNDAARNVNKMGKVILNNEKNSPTTNPVIIEGKFK